jgi:histone-lysine N-methyltransferase SETMAR
MTAEINSTLGNNTVSVRTCQRHVSKYQSNNFSSKDEEHPGRPSLDIDEEIMHCLDEDKRATCRSIALAIDQSHETVWRHLKKMDKKYLENCWVPHQLTDVNKLKRKEICHRLLGMFQANDFLSQLVTCDEIWVYWDNEGTFNNRSWRGPGENPISTPTRRLTNRKHLASVFWDVKGVIMMDVLPQGQTINANVYCSQLDRLVLAIQEKRRRLFSGGCHNIHFLHDNATPHTAGVTVAKLRSIGFTILPHPPYSPDLSPCDFYLFSPLKCSLRGKTYNSSDEISVHINDWFDSKPKQFFLDGIRKLPGRWRKCIEHNGEYFSHLNDTDA